MRLDVELKNMLQPHGPTQDAKIIVWAHNSHVGDVRATELHGAHGAQRAATALQAAAVRGAAQVAPKWSLGHLMRETFGRPAVYSLAFSTYDGSVTAAHKWGDVAQCLQLNAAIDGSVGATLHTALPVVRSVHQCPLARAFALVFSDRGLDGAPPAAVGTAARVSSPGHPATGGITSAAPAPSGITPARGSGAAGGLQGHQQSVWRGGDPADAAREAAREAARAEALLGTLGSPHLRAARIRTLREILYPPRPFRAVGVAYKKDDELRAHYVTTVLPELVDALIHIDTTDALTPLDRTPEWSQGYARLTHP